MVDLGIETKLPFWWVAFYGPYIVLLGDSLLSPLNLSCDLAAGAPPRAVFSPCRADQKY